MKNMALKTVLCILMCIPLAAAVIAAVNLSKNGEKGEEVPGRTLVVKYGDTVQTETSDSENLTVYDAVIANATSITNAVSEIEQATHYTVEMSDSTGTKTYDFYMTQNLHNCVYSDAEGNFFGLVPDDAEKLLLRSEFAHVYTSNTLPTASFKCDVEISGVPQTRSFDLTADKYDWNVTLINGEAKECVYDGSELSANYIKMSQGGVYSFSFSDAPDSVLLKALHDGKTVFSGTPEEFNENAISRQDDTEYTIELSATYIKNDSRDYSGEATFIIKALYDVPTTYVSQDKGVGIGEFTIIEAINANVGENFSVSGDMYLAEDVRMQQNGSKFFMLLPADISCSVDGDNELTITSSDWGMTRMPFPIKSKTFGEFEVNSASAALHYTEATISQYKEAIASVLPQSVREQLWSDSVGFIAPCRGDYSNFGRTLILNDEEKINNIGIDIYAEEGTPVVPTHSGRVVYTGNLDLTGNIIIIDHGFDVFSYYMHLATVDCKVGDSVTQNSVIGSVGSTGFMIEETPYLLFAVSVGSTYTNPVSIFKWGIKIPS